MDPQGAMMVTREALTLALVVAGPLLLTALLVGSGIGLLQALTQIQEATISFVPKLVAIGLVLMLALPMIGRAMGAFMVAISQRIVSGA